MSHQRNGIYLLSFQDMTFGMSRCTENNIYILILSSCPITDTIIKFYSIKTQREWGCHITNAICHILSHRTIIFWGIKTKTEHDILIMASTHDPIFYCRRKILRQNQIAPHAADVVTTLCSVIFSRQASLARQAFLITPLHGARYKTGKNAYAK